MVDETTLAGGSTIGGITVGSKGVESGGKGGVKSGEGVLRMCSLSLSTISSTGG